jgi:hypothetical protein
LSPAQLLHVDVVEPAAAVHLHRPRAQGHSGGEPEESAASYTADLSPGSAGVNFFSQSTLLPALFPRRRAHARPCGVGIVNG